MEPDDTDAAQIPANSAGAVHPSPQPPSPRAPTRVPRVPARLARVLVLWAVICTALLAVLDLLAGCYGVYLSYYVAQLSEPAPTPAANVLFAVFLLSALFFAPGVLYGLLSIGITRGSRGAAAWCALLAALTLVLPLWGLLSGSALDAVPVAVGYVLVTVVELASVSGAYWALRALDD